MKKTFILDTNVLLHDVNSIYAFEDNDVVIPMVVIEELDNFKSEGDTRGKNARMVSRELDELRKKGRLNEGVKLPKGGTLKIELDKPNILPQILSFNKSDNSIFLKLLSTFDIYHLHFYQSYFHLYLFPIFLILSIMHLYFHLANSVYKLFQL